MRRITRILLVSSSSTQVAGTTATHVCTSASVCNTYRCVYRCNTYRCVSLHPTHGYPQHKHTDVFPYTLHMYIRNIHSHPLEYMRHMYICNPQDCLQPCKPVTTVTNPPPHLQPPGLPATRLGYRDRAQGYIISISLMIAGFSLDSRT